MRESKSARIFRNAFFCYSVETSPRVNAEMLYRTRAKIYALRAERSARVDVARAWNETERFNEYAEALRDIRAR